MKKVLAILLAAVLVISLSGCGIPFTAKKIIDDSEIYSKRDIEKAMNRVYREFAFFEGCVLLELEYDEEYSKERLNQRLYLSRQIVFKPLSQKSIFEEYCKTNKYHKGIYGLYLYYCYLLGVFPKKYPKQYLPYSIRKEVYKLEQTSQ